MGRWPWPQTDGGLIQGDGGQSGDDQGIIILRHGKDPITCLNDGIHGRVQGGIIGTLLHAHDGRSLVGHQGLAIGFANQAGFPGEVNLVAAEIQQFGIDGRKAALARGLGGDTRDQVACQHGLHLVALADHLDQVHILRIADLGHDVVGPFPAVGIVGQRQDGLNDRGIRVVAFGRQDDDGFGRMRAANLEVRQVDRVARAADDAGAAGRLDAGVDFVFHLDLVPVCQDDDAGVMLVFVGNHQLGEDGEDLRGPAQDERMAAFNDTRAAFAQIIHFGFDAAGEGTDQDADHEQAAERDHQHDDQILPGIAGIHRVGCERLGHDIPEDLPDLLACGNAMDKDHDASRQEDQEGRAKRQPANDDQRPAGKAVVEPVAEAFAQGGFIRHGILLKISFHPKIQEEFEF